MWNIPKILTQALDSMATKSPKSTKKDSTATIGFEAKLWLTADVLCAEWV
jgi:hypothetical protein